MNKKDPNKQASKMSSRIDVQNNNLVDVDDNIAMENMHMKNKNWKQTKNLNKKRKQATFGICFDCDGVLARGTLALPSAVKAFKKLTDEKGELKVPVTFVTNALNRNCDKANQIGGWFNVNIKEQQMIQAQGPLEVFTKLHDKFCLIIGQGKIMEIATELGFKNMCTLDDITKAYPLLDMVDHDNRQHVAKYGYRETDFARVEAVILMGEPKKWDSSLQVLVDLLKTNGKPDHSPEAIPEQHIPVVACNMDLQFMDRACMPRYGHGAYLLCLEALYKKSSGRPLKYTALIGKPSEITFRYSEHCLTREAQKMGIDQPLKRMYVIGDTPEVDIVGTNLYQRYVDRLWNRRENITELSTIENDREKKDYLMYDPELPASRNVPAGTVFHKQTVHDVESILVCTGCFKPGDQPEAADEKNNYGHRDFPHNPVLYKPTLQCEDVLEAIDYIFDKEDFQ